MNEEPQVGDIWLWGKQVPCLILAPVENEEHGYYHVLYIDSGRRGIMAWTKHIAENWRRLA